MEVGRLERVVLEKVLERVRVRVTEDCWVGLGLGLGNWKRMVLEWGCFLDGSKGGWTSISGGGVELERWWVPERGSEAVEEKVEEKVRQMVARRRVGSQDRRCSNHRLVVT